MNYRQSKRFPATRIVRVSRSGRDRFEVRNEDETLPGAGGDEIKAIWSAVLAADLMSRQDRRVRVMVKRGDTYFEDQAAPAIGLDLRAS